MSRGPAILLLASAIAGCSTAPGSWDAPGTGWSRAPDLSIYAAMTEFADIAREQSMLCQGFSPQSVRSHWDDEFGVREDAVTAGLVARHGAAAVAAAEAAAVVTRRVECRDVPNDRWEDRYARLLRLLETRLAMV